MPMISFTPIKEGLRMARRARRVRRTGFHRYKGTPEDICEQVIEDTFDPQLRYYRVSPDGHGHFCEFYTRDFAFCCEALQRLGHAKEVTSTLRYALERFERAGMVMTAINPEGEPFDYFLPSGPESLALLLYSVTHTGNERLAREHAAFLQRQADDFVKHFVDRETLLPRADKRFSTIRDHAKRKAAVYDAVMIAVAARECKRLGIRFPYEEEDIADEIVKRYWNGTYFFQDLTRQPIVAGDANVFPFWTGIIAGEAGKEGERKGGDRMREQAFAAMRAAGLDTPFPLRYISPLDKKREKTAMHGASLLAPDYETDSVWMHLGLAYLRVLAQVDKDLAREHLERYTRLIESHATFLEVYDTHGEPFRRAFYVSDEAMLWCANYLVLKEDLEKR